MSSILYGIKEITVDDMINEQVTYKLWENAGRKIMEAQLTADQINQLFANIEQGATDAGGNRTMLGKGKDAASAVNKAWEELKTKVQNSGPIKNVDAMYDQAAEKLKQATGGDQGVMKYVQKYRDFAKKHPVAQSIIYSALIAAAGISGAGLGGAAALGLFKMVDKLLQGEKFSSAAYSGAKTGAMAYGASKVGDLIRGQNAGGAGDAAASAAGNMAPNAIAKNALQIVKEKIQNGEVTDWNSYQKAVNSALEEAIKAGGGQATGISKQMAGKILSNQLDRYALDAAGQFSGSGPEKIEKIISALGGQVDQEKMAAAKRAVTALRGANESIELNEANIRLVFSKASLEHDKMLAEGLWDTIKGKAAQVGKNLTTKVTADKLQSAWKKAGSPTDSAEIAKLLTQNGVAQEVVDKVFTQMKIPTTAPAQPAAQTQKSQAQQAAPAQQAAKPAAQAQPQAAVKPAKPGAPAVKQAQPQNRVGGVRQQGGTFAYNPLAEGDFEVHVPGYGTMPLEMLKRHVKELTKDFNDTVQGEEFIKAAYRTEQLYNALFALSKAMKAKSKELDETHSTGTTIGSAGIGGGSGLGIEKSPIEKVLEKPLGEHINSPGGMGQAYRKFTPKSSGTEALNEYDDNLVNIVINNVPKGLTIDQFYPKAFSEMLYWKYRRSEKDNFLSVAKGWYDEYKQKHNMKEYDEKRAVMKIKDIDRIEDLLYTLPKGLDFNKFLDVALRQYIDNKYSTKEFSDWKNKTKYLYWDAYKKAGKDKPEGVVSKIKGWFNEEDLEEEQAPMFTPEDEAKMVNANDPKSDGWRVYKVRTAGTKESAIMKGLQTEVKGHESSKGK